MTFFLGGIKRAPLARRLRKRARYVQVSIAKCHSLWSIIVTQESICSRLDHYRSHRCMQSIGKKNGPTAWHLLSRENLNCSVWFVMDLNRGTMPFFILAQSWSIDFIDVILTVDNVNDLTTGFPTFINDWFNVISSLCWTVWKTWSVPRPISTTFLHRGRPSVMCNNSSRMCFRTGSIRPSGCSCWAPPVSARRRSRPSLWRRNTSTLTKLHLVIWFYSIHQYSKLLQLSQSHWKWSDDLNKLFFLWANLVRLC